MKEKQYINSSFYILLNIIDSFKHIKDMTQPINLAMEDPLTEKKLGTPLEMWQSEEPDTRQHLPSLVSLSLSC